MAEVATLFRPTYSKDPDVLDVLSDLLSKARAAGADSADAILYSSTSLSVERRLGQMENLERSESRDLGLRVFVGKRSAIVSATSVDPARFGDLAEPDVGALIARAEAAEQAALAVAGVTNSEGGSAGYSRSDIFLATSAGF